MTEEQLAEAIDCPTCDHPVQPHTARAPTMLAGTVITIRRCPECDSVIDVGRQGGAK